MSNFEDVKDFMTTYGQEVKTKSEFPEEQIIKLRIDLIKEELNELTDAIKQRNLVEVADALTDILYVTYGAGHSFGIALFSGHSYQHGYSFWHRILFSRAFLSAGYSFGIKFLLAGHSVGIAFYSAGHSILDCIRPAVHSIGKEFDGQDILSWNAFNLQVIL